jgi:hypothetical protein
MIFITPKKLRRWDPRISVTQHSTNQPNWGLHLTPLRGAGEAGR